MTRRRQLLLACLALGCVVAGPVNAGGGMMKLRTLEGASVMLPEFFEPGKWTVVMLWTTYCTVCRSQFPMVNAFHDAHAERDAKVIGVALDGLAEAATVTAHVAAHGMRFPTLLTEVGEAAASLVEATGKPFAGTPTYLLFDGHGALRARVDGPLRPAALEAFVGEHPP